MDMLKTKITNIDANEATIEFSDKILVCRPQLVNFQRALEELIDEYAI